MGGLRGGARPPLYYSFNVCFPLSSPSGEIDHGVYCVYFYSDITACNCSPLARRCRSDIINDFIEAWQTKGLGNR